MTYDIIIIGGGAAGLTCAIGASKLNKKVLLIEKRKLGGECTWAGCVPSKALIYLSKQMKDDTIFKEVRKISEEIYQNETPEVLQKMNIDVVIGEAIFKDKYSIIVQNELYSAKKIVIAAGTSPFVPPITGIDSADFLTNETLFKLTKIPKEMIFIGSGVIALELSLPMARLGSKITILEKNKEIFVQEDIEIQRKFKEILDKYEIKLITGIDIKSIHSDKTTQTSSVEYEKDGQTYQLSAEKIFISSGRKPNTEGMGLENIGVVFSNKGISIDSFLRTNVKNIYAMGDVADTAFRFSHIAGAAGETFIRNLIIPFMPKKFMPDTIPFVVFTDPEYSRTGLTQHQCEQKFGKDQLRIYTIDRRHVDRAVISFDKEFCIKVICRNGKIEGAWCLGERAGEIIGLLQFLKSQNIPFYKITESIQAYPTYTEALRKLAKQALIDRIFDNPIIKMFKK